MKFDTPIDIYDIITPAYFGGDRSRVGSVVAMQEKVYQFETDINMMRALCLLGMNLTSAGALNYVTLRK